MGSRNVAHERREQVSEAPLVSVRPFSNE